MKAAIASDHGGFELKQGLIKHYKGKGLTFVDFGTDSDPLVYEPLFSLSPCGGRHWQSPCTDPFHAYWQDSGG